MSLIKSTEVLPSRVRLLPPQSAPAVPAESVVDVERIALARELEALSRQLGEREARVATLEKAVDAAFADGEEKGRAAGRRQADDDRHERLQRLEAGIERALGAHADQMRELERLAVLLARAGLDKLLGQSEHFPALVSQALRLQIEKLSGEAVVRIEVSAKDFADAAALAQLACRLNRPDLDLAATHELAAGNCRIRLKLGLIEAGVEQQWRRLRALFDEAVGLE